jgi:hypothetical protein
MDHKEIIVDTRNLVNSVHDRDYWRALVNAALNHGLHKPWSESISSRRNSSIDPVVTIFKA